jgi:hypothetical protein
MKKVCFQVAKMCAMLLSVLLSNALQAQQCSSGNCQNGKGTLQFASGAKYSGDFKNGLMHGQGILYFTNGDKYLGDFTNQYREGEGKFMFANGNEYKGKFKKNKMDGEGVLKYTNGDRYEGIFQNDLPNGQGTLVLADGTRKAGIFKNGQLPDNQTSIQETITTAKKIRNCNDEYCHDCQGEYSYSDGSKYVGSFKNGYPEGEGTIQYVNGDKYVGGWGNHAPNGEGIMYYKSGRVFGGVWKYGTPIKELEQVSSVPKEHVEEDKDNAVKIWSVIVGIGRYAHMPTLKYPDDDAYHFYAFLKSPEGGALPDEQVKVLIDEDATRDNILRAMRQVFLKADENDVVMLYFSGHGLDGSFIPVDYDGFNNKLRHEDVKAIFNESKAKHKICMADACFSGSLYAVKSTVDVTLDKYYNAFNKTQGGMALLMSSKSEEYSLEDHGLRSGIFSHYLIRGLKGEADKDKNKIVTIKELYDFTQKNVHNYTAGAQNPTISGAYDPNMPVGVIR